MTEVQGQPCTIKIRDRSVLPVLLSLGLALAPAAPAAAQEEEPVVIGTTTTLRSEILDEDRRLHLPAVLSSWRCK